MAFDTKINLTNNKFEQFSGETLTLSGNTEIYGLMKIENEGRITSDSGYEISGTSFLRAGSETTTSIELGSGANTASALNAVSIGTNTIATGACSTAIGCASHSCNTSVVSIGSNAGFTNITGLTHGISSTSIGLSSNCNNSIGANSTAIGSSSKSVGANSTAIGRLSCSLGGNSTAIGNPSCAIGASSTAIGISSCSLGASSTAIGNGSYSVGNGSTAIGILSKSEGASSTAIGNSAGFSFAACSHGTGSTSIGLLSNFNTNIGACSTAIGACSTSLGSLSTAIGILSKSEGSSSTAIGCASYSLCTNSTAIGTRSHACNTSVVSIGSNAGFTNITGLTHGINTVSIGLQSNCNNSIGANSTAIGSSSKSVGAGSTAIGNLSCSLGTDSTAIGCGNKACGISSTAIGDTNKAYGACSTVIGGFNNTLCSTNSVLIGTSNNNIVTASTYNNHLIVDNIAILDTPSTGASGDTVLVRDPSTGIIRDIQQSGLTSNPSGSNTEVQFNDNGSFGSSSSFTYDGTRLNLPFKSIGNTSTPVGTLFLNNSKLQDPSNLLFYRENKVVTTTSAISLNTTITSLLSGSTATVTLYANGMKESDGSLVVGGKSQATYVKSGTTAPVLVGSIIKDISSNVGGAEDITFILSGDNIQGRVVGDNSTTFTWFVTAEVQYSQMVT